MTFLYIYPHPDDESFGPAIAISRQRRSGHRVHLLTLTRGHATRFREPLGLTIPQMKARRVEELERAAVVLELSGLAVLDFPDGGLKDLDPRELEQAITAELDRVRPQVVVTFAAHGISGHPDHLATHAAVKQAFAELRDNGGSYLRRLAFSTISPGQAEGYSRRRRLAFSPAEEIGCCVRGEARDIETFHRALDCYGTFRELIAELGVKEHVGDTTCFEIFGERHQPPLEDLAKF